MSRRELQAVAQQEERLREIERRWASIARLRAWSAEPPKLRARVIAELEETSRQLEATTPEASAFTSALDALEAIPDVVDLLALHVAGEDVRALIELAKNARRSG